MRFLTSSLVLSGWLLVSAFVLPQTAGSAAVAVLAAFVMVSLSAFAVGRPGVRYANTVLALLLAAFALLGNVPWVAALNDALVASAYFVLTLISPQHHREETPAAAHVK